MDFLGVNTVLNLIGTIGVIACSIFIIAVKIHLKKREEYLNRKLEDLLILTDKLIEHTQEIKDQGIILDQKENSGVVISRETSPKTISRI